MLFIACCHKAGNHQGFDSADYGESFFVGDAAGRTGDFADSDKYGPDPLPCSWAPPTRMHLVLCVLSHALPVDWQRIVSASSHIQVLVPCTCSCKVRAQGLLGHDAGDHVGSLQPTRGCPSKHQRKSLGELADLRQQMQRLKL